MITEANDGVHIRRLRRENAKAPKLTRTNI